MDKNFFFIFTGQVREVNCGIERFPLPCFVNSIVIPEHLFNAKPFDSIARVLFFPIILEEE